jgi:hypothetical protein
MVHGGSLLRAVTTLRVLWLITAAAIAAAVLSYAGLSVLTRRPLTLREFTQLAAAILRATPAHALGENPVETIRLGANAYRAPLRSTAVAVDSSTRLIPLPPLTVRMPADSQRFVTFASTSELQDYLFAALPAAGWRRSDQFGSMHVYESRGLQLSVRSAFYRGTRIGDLRFALARVDGDLPEQPLQPAITPSTSMVSPAPTPDRLAPIATTPPLPEPKPTDTIVRRSPPRRRALLVRPLFRVHNSGFTDRVRIILGDSAEWRDFWLRTYSLGNIPARPTVDFEREVVVGVAMGRRATGGYSIHIDSARTAATGVEIFVRSVSPGRRCGTTAALTEPAAAAAIPRTSLSPRIIEMADTVRCP